MIGLVGGRKRRGGAHLGAACRRCPPACEGVAGLGRVGCRHGHLSGRRIRGARIRHRAATLAVPGQRDGVGVPLGIVGRIRGRQGCVGRNLRTARCCGVPALERIAGLRRIARRHGHFSAWRIGLGRIRHRAATLAIPCERDGVGRLCQIELLRARSSEVLLRRAEIVGLGRLVSGCGPPNSGVARIHACGRLGR